ncbi:MAG: putative manganese transporter [Candidatus Cryptobacteroides sp.]
MHLFIDILRNSILITGLVTVMMMMIESLNIESNGLVFKGLRKTKTGQVVIAALLGSIPGCMGGFATVSLYTHGLFSFGALIAMMIASSGDEAFVLLAMVPDKAMMIFMILFVVAVAAGIITDMVKDRLHRRKCHKADHSECCDIPDCQEGYVVHDPEQEHPHEHKGHGRHFGWKRCVMFIGLALFIAALATGRLSHEHGTEGHDGHEHHCECTCAHGDGAHGELEHGHIHEDDHATASFKIDLLSEDWMNVLFAGLSVIVLVVLILASDHFIEEHLWNHIVRKHLPTIFAWTFGVLLVIGIGLQYIDIEDWISDNTILMILLATAVGIIPESGPHLVFVTLYAAGLVPMPVLLASCISQDGHASIPLLAESKKGFISAKLINCAVALIVGFAAYLFI